MSWSSTGTGAAGTAGAAALVAAAAAAVLFGGARREPRAIRCRAARKGTPLEELKVGDEFDGTVTRVANIGAWINIGAEKEALLPRTQLRGKEYKPGDKISGLKISEVSTGDTPSERKIRVTLAEQMSASSTFSDLEVGGRYEGKVARSTGFGVFFNIGAGGDVLAPVRFLSKEAGEYQPGETVPLKVVSIEGSKVTVTTRVEGSEGTGIEIKDLKVGAGVEGVVARVSAMYGLFINIGAVRDALCRTNQLEKAISEYNEGDKISGLKIAKVDLKKEQVELTFRRLTSDVEEGEKLEGTVSSITSFGVFFDAGLASDVLSPSGMLSKPPDQYTKGEVADLVVMQVEGDRISVSTQADAEVGTTLAGLVRGSEVTGKVLRTDRLGLFLDIGASKDALLRAENLPKAPSEYSEGEELEGLLITKIDLQAKQVEVSTPAALAEKAAQKELSELTVGMQVSGTVRRATEFGVFVDVGAERDALWPANQLPKPPSEFQVGDEVTGLRITLVDAEKSRLAVSDLKSAADFEVGEEVEGTVTKIAPFGIFVSIGASTDALAPRRLLVKDVGEYAVGEELSGLKIAQLDVENNKISVGMEGAKEAQDASGRISFADLEVGKKIKGVVRMTKDYGVFVDIGLGRRDGLLPGKLLGSRTPESFKANDEVEVYIADVDADKDRVTLSLEEPPEGGVGQKKYRLVTNEKPPFNDMVPDPVYWAKRIGREDLMDDEPIPWDEWAEKYPGMIKLPEKEVELYLCNTGFGFSGLDAVSQSRVEYIPIPMHLRKNDAGPPEIPEFSFNDYQMGYEYGIKPEIHVKYRTPPFNDPNWVHHPGKGKN